jgi:cysteinyl-tRNA synthetase, unknown class
MNRITLALCCAVLTLCVQALGVQALGASNPTRLELSQSIGTASFIRVKPAWRDIQSWGVQYQQFKKDNLTQIAALPIDLVALGRLDGWGREWQPANIKEIKRDKWLLAYISAGQAQPHEWYWQDAWRTRPPAWKIPRETRFGSFNVYYWDKEWQKIVMQTIDRIIKSGFDGMFVDQADPYWNTAFPGSASVENQQHSKDLVCAMSKYARAKQPGFRIVTNGTADLLDFPGFSSCIDGIAAEHLWFKATHTKGDPGYREFVLKQMPKAQKAGLKIFTFDYTEAEDEMGFVVWQSSARGFIPFIGGQGLKGTPRVY